MRTLLRSQKRFRSLAIALVGCCAVAGIGSQVKVTALSLKKGDIWKATVSLRYIDKEAEIDETHVERIDATVLEPLPLKVQFSRKLVQTIINGDAIPALAGVKPEEYVEALNFRNELLGSTQSVVSPSQVRVARLLRVIHPAGQHDGRWTAEIPGKPEEGIPDSVAQYSLAGAAEHDGRTFTKIKVRYAEKTEPGISAEGTGEIDNLTGLVSELRLRAINVYPPGGMQRTAVEISYTVTAWPKR